MTSVTYDFVVLGDQQPEGLFVASGLARKGYSVGLVPSSSLGELPTDDFIPLTLPSQAAGRRLDDLLFRAGFFRLEDSGLVSTQMQAQMILSKNRLAFDGSEERFVSEVAREFPLVAKDFLRIWELLKHQASEKISLRRAVIEVEALLARDPAFARWVEDSIHLMLKPPVELNASKELRRMLLKKWFEYLLNQSSKAYRVDPKLKTSYSQFLVEHSRKWGVHVIQDAIELDSKWSGFKITSQTRSKHCIINSVGGDRALAKLLHKPVGDRLKSWLYFDRIDCPLSAIPEPLQEFSIVDFYGDGSERCLYLVRDPLRDEARLSLGSWLSFDDSKAWMTEIEKGRQALLKLIPYLPQESFRQIPSLLELTEIRGECVKRGQFDRLVPVPNTHSKMQNLMRWISDPMRRKKNLHSIAHRVFSVHPHDLPLRNRMASFEASLQLLDYFDHKRAKLRPNSLF